MGPYCRKCWLVISDGLISVFWLKFDNDYCNCTHVKKLHSRGEDILAK